MVVASSDVQDIMMQGEALHSYALRIDHKNCVYSVDVQACLNVQDIMKGQILNWFGRC